MNAENEFSPDNYRIAKIIPTTFAYPMFMFGCFNVFIPFFSKQ